MSAPTFDVDEVLLPETAPPIEPLVSVVIPTYNRARLVRRAVESAMKQTHAKLEIIVVDDASIDDTAATIEELRDPRVRYVRHGTNKGGSAARNTGIRMANGDFVAFLDDDDRWEPSKIARQLKEIQAYDGVICGFSLAHPTGLRPPGASAGVRKTVARETLKRGYYVGWGTSSLMVRRAVLERMKFDESLLCGQDWDLVIRLTETFRIGYFDERLVIVDNVGAERISTGSANMPVDQIERRMRVLQKHRAYLGAFWFNYHAALTLLYGLRRRENRARHLLYTIRRCGVVPVAAGFVNRAYHGIVGY